MAEIGQNPDAVAITDGPSRRYRSRLEDLMTRMVMIVGAAVLAGTALLGQQRPAAASADKARLESAINKEVIDGDLQAAVVAYQELTKSPDRAVAAQSYLRLGQAYLRLNHPKATATLREASRFVDHPQIVAKARAALARSSQPATTGVRGLEPSFRRVWGEGADTTGSVSADGRYLSYTDWVTGDLAVRNLQDGSTRRLTDKGTWAESSEYAERSVFSPDGRAIAFGWAPKQTLQPYELRIADTTASGSRRVLTDVVLDFVAPWDWSVDGSRIAVLMARRDSPLEAGVVDARAGTLVSAFVAEGANALRFTPDSQALVFDRTRAGTIVTDIVMRSVVDGAERVLVEGGGRNLPIAWTPDGGLLFASNRGGSQGLWLQAFADGWKRNGTPVVVKGDVGVRPLGMTESGALFVGTTASNLEVRLGALERSGTTLALSEGTALESYMGINMTPDWSRDGTALAFLTRRDRSNRPPVIGIREMGTGHMRELTPELRLLNFPRWASDKATLYIQGRDMADKQGLFRVDASTGAVSTIEMAGGDILGVGFPMPSPDGRLLYYGRRVGATDNVVVARDLRSGAVREVVRSTGNVPPPALSHEGTHIAWARVNPASKATELFVVPVAGGEPKVVHTEPAPNFVRFISWLPRGKELLIVRSRDGSMGQKVVLIAIDGARPREVAAPDTVNGPLAVHPDGRRVAYPAGARLDEVWVLENFLPQAKTARQ